ncbi:response regulator [Hydrogenophaga sp. PAMC20947]|uniref:hybrid sensor histidine kinase/response regulator n=1 Tax=Hydrogenophaga sp. PAMC20947 TaxID=2565558 RepID=UPI00109DB910|nr:response regulator [Hydrogenophaga sp. PAMC20947]QCB47436.1 response regulator [Hydrogenophaga sp. PAMC20947]
MKRVLVVDDNASNLYLLRQLLESSGYAVDEAQHGVEALVKARQCTPDILITDLLMPEMDGYALLRQWKADPTLKGIPSIVYTATYTDPEDARLARDIGADAFIVKPMEADDLLAFVDKTIVEAREGAPSTAPTPALEPEQGLTIYNAYLVRKLEKRSQEMEALAAEREQAIRALQTTERQFRALADHSLDMILQTEPGSVVHWANRAACEGFGRTEAEILCVRRSDLFDESDARLHALLAVREATGRMRGEATALRKDGTPFPVELSSVVYRTAAGETLANVTLRDLSAQKAAEAAYQTSQAVVASLQTAMNAHALLSTADEAGNITYVNDRFCAVSGYSRAELLGQNHRLLRSGLHGPTTYQHLWNTLRTGDVWKSEVCNRAKDGSLFWVDATIVPMKGPHTPVTQYVAIYTDITRRKLADQRRDELEAQLRETQKLQAVGTLASGIAHDFNNIVAAILGFSLLMREEIPPTGDAAEYLNQIQKAGKRARELVQRILSFSRPQPTARKDVVLQDVVQEALAIATATLPASISLQQALQEAPVHVSADATQLQQVLINLYTNAWHAAPAEAARIETGLDIRVFELKDLARPADLPPGQFAHLWIKDNGMGMAPGVRARIFEPFFTTKPTGQGTGLGLSAVRSIVGVHHGAIVVESQPQLGTTFHLYFPVLEARGLAAPTATSAVRPAALRGSPRVLYVDDDEPVALLAQTLLSREGFRVTAFTHAEQALAAVRAHAHDFDLMVTDFNMPGMSGLELARRVQSIRGDLPIAIVSGYIDAELTRQAHAIQIQTLVHKERVPEELADRLRHLLAPLEPAPPSHAP